MAQAGLGWRVPYGAGNAEADWQGTPCPWLRLSYQRGCLRELLQLKAAAAFMFNPDPWPWLSTTRPQASGGAWLSQTLTPLLTFSS